MEKTAAVEIKKPEVMVVDGVVLPTTIDEAFRVSKALCMSGMMPAQYKTPEQVFVGMQFACELGLKPMTALRQISVINGNPSIWGDLPMALCYAKNLVEWKREWWFDKDQKKICTENGNLLAEVFGAAIQIKRRGDPEVEECSFTLAEADKAGLLGNVTWKKYAKRMLRYRARSQALKDKFPDALNGIAIAEYDANVNPEDEGVLVATAIASPASELQSRFEVIEANDVDG